LEEITLHDLKPGNYTVKLYFAELDDNTSKERIQTIYFQDEIVLRDFVIRDAAMTSMSGVIRQFDDVLVDGTLKITMNATGGKSLISGFEVIRTVRSSS